jgi:TPR repeat protein
VEWFRKASDQGCPRGLQNLGTCYELGKGVEVDTDQAFHMYKESAEKGNVAGMLSLALLCYKTAKQTKSQKQFKMAAHWFLELTMRDSENAEPWFYLGQLY